MSQTLYAECIRTFSTVTFPATLLLKREETETNKLSGVQKKEVAIGNEAGPSVIAALHHGRGDTNRMYKDPPFDLLYGFRGGRDSVDLLSPYEMLLHYGIERIMPPTNLQAMSRAEWTPAGEQYREECREARMRGHYKPGEHYIAIEGEDRILLPDLPDLYGSRSCWC